MKYDRNSTTEKSVSNIYHFQDKNNDALNALREAEKLSIGSDDISLKAAIKHNRVKFYYIQGGSREAMFVLHDEFELSKKSGEKIVYIYTVMKMGLFSLLQRNMDKAQSYFEEMWKLIKDTDYVEGKARYLLSMCLLYALQKQADGIFNTCGEALKLAQHWEISFDIKFYSLIGISYGYTIQGRSEALEFFKNAQEFSQESDAYAMRQEIARAGVIIASEILNQINAVFIDVSVPFGNLWLWRK